MKSSWPSASKKREERGTSTGPSVKPCGGFVKNMLLARVKASMGGGP